MNRGWFATRRGATRCAAALVMTVSLALALALAAGGVRAEVAAADPIDAAMRACLARSDMSSTLGQIQCMDTARMGWKAAGQAAWQQLLAKSGPAQRRAWERSQARWQAAHESQKALLAAVFSTTRGTMYQIALADMELQPVRDRALALRSAAANAGSGDAAPARLPRCTDDAECEHAMFDLNRYERRLRIKLPASERTTLARAQRAWMDYLDASIPLVDARGRLDIIGAHLATLKRLSDTAGNQ